MAKLPDLTPEQIEKVQRLRGKDPESKVSPEMYFLAEFGHYFGWDGIVAIETGVIKLQKAIELLEAARKVRYADLYQQSLAMFYANKDAKTFNKGMKPFISRMEIDE